MMKYVLVEFHGISNYILKFKKYSFNWSVGLLYMCLTTDYILNMYLISQKAN